MTARTELVTELTATLPTSILVLPYARGIDPPTKPTVMVRVDQVTPSSNPQAQRDYQFALVLIATKTEAGPADDELDGLLEDVLYELDKSTKINWTTAERATYEEKFPAYEVTVTIHTNYA